MRRLLLPLLALLLAGCPTDDPGPGGADEYTPPEFDQGPPISSRADLRLKRWRHVTNDLAGGLELPLGELCRETGLYDCSTLHVIPLGGISLDNGLFRGLDDHAVTTGLAIDRFVLHACWNRLRRDLDPDEDEAAVVFGDVADDPSSTDLPAGADALVADLYRRLLARDPAEDETEALLGLFDGIVEDGGGAADWALMSCYAVGTSTEGLLY